MQIHERLILIEKTNKYRSVLGVEVVQPHEHLMNSAQRWADSMAKEGHNQHSDFGPENIAWGMDTCEQAFAWWQNSSGHNTHLLHDSYRYIGVGVATSPTGCKCYVQHFASTMPGEIGKLQGVGHRTVTFERRPRNWQVAQQEEQG